MRAIYQVYHNTYTAAVNAAENYAKSKGYELNQEQLAVDVGMNSKRPKDGETTRFSAELWKAGKPQRKRLQVQVYGRGTTYNNFELNCYIL